MHKFLKRILGVKASQRSLIYLRGKVTDNGILFIATKEYAVCCRNSFVR